VKSQKNGQIYNEKENKLTTGPNPKKLKNKTINII
jgi:hypothetical protein